MTKLRTGEIINLIAAIEDSILLKCELQNGETGTKFPKVRELLPLKNRLGELIKVVDVVSALLEQRESIMNLADEMMEHKNEPDK
jgi:hypothetical protein